MRKITEIEFVENQSMVVIFDNGVSKKIDFHQFLDKEVFLPLLIAGNFYKAKNKGFFIEWEGLEIDISADTLWHSGQVLLSNTPVI